MIYKRIVRMINSGHSPTINDKLQLPN